MSEDAAEYAEEWVCWRERGSDEKHRATVGSRGGGYDIELIICHLSSNQGLNISFPLSTEWKDELCRPGQTRWYWIINTASGNLAGPPAESTSALSRVTGGLCLNNSCPSAIWFHPIFRSLLLNQLIPCFRFLLLTYSIRKWPEHEHEILLLEGSINENTAASSWRTRYFCAV